LPELALTEENQQVAIKLDEALSPSLFTFHLRIVGICRNQYYVFIAAPVYKKPGEEGGGLLNLTSPVLDRIFDRLCRIGAAKKYSLAGGHILPCGKKLAIRANHFGRDRGS
jgi:hypothetical protein